jgi:hypothetical protein
MARCMMLYQLNAQLKMDANLQVISSMCFARKKHKLCFDEMSALFGNTFFGLYYQDINRPNKIYDNASECEKTVC